MRSTGEILVALEGNGRPDYEELRLTCLVLKRVLYSCHNDIKRLIKGGTGAELTKRDYPAEHAELGISKQEWKAIRMDPKKYLTPRHIPGTQEWEKGYKISKRIFEKIEGIVNDVRKETMSHFGFDPEEEVSQKVAHGFPKAEEAWKKLRKLSEFEDFLDKTKRVRITFCYDPDFERAYIRLEGLKEPNALQVQDGRMQEDLKC